MANPQPARLLKWYSSNYRDFPWRETKDPYKIWVSEIMLQQTTSTAVLPYYKNFIKKFPSVKKLANSEINKLYEAWQGLGYYSRPRNMHKAAKAIVKLKKFPQTHEELIQLPGFGPYIARAVSSFAFHESVGVLDGNVIRFLSRFHGQSVEWWKTQGRNILQSFSDQWAQKNSHLINQALIEIGATLCTPTNPNCIICPLSKTCESFRTKTQDNLPLKKPKKDKEIWVWEPIVANKKNKMALTNQHTCPFLKNQWIYPGKSKKIKQAPKKFDFRHNITHHDIYVKLKYSKGIEAKEDLKWVQPKDIAKLNPSSLLQKVLSHYQPS